MSPTSPSSSASSTGSSPDSRPIASLRRRLGGLQANLMVDLALRRGLVRREDLDRCLEEASPGRPIASILVEKGLLDEARLVALVRELKEEDLKELVGAAADPPPEVDASRRIGRYVLG